MLGDVTEERHVVAETTWSRVFAGQEQVLVAPVAGSDCSAVPAVTKP